MGNDAKITLVRPDGSTLDASPEQADRLSVLGYKPITPIQQEQQLASDAQSEYYTSTGQQLKAGLEGVGSGASLGLTDYAFGDDDTKARAQYNPGWRLAGETLGAILPLVLSDGTSAGVSGVSAAEEGAAGLNAERGLGRFLKAPTTLLGDAAEAVSVGREGSLTNAITRGAAEGGLFGGVQAADHAYLDGDPLTAETILHGAGWGAVAGGLFAGGLHAVSGVGKSAQEVIAAEKAVEDAKTAAIARQEAERTGVIEENSAKLENWRKAVREAKETAQPIKYGALEDLAGGDFGALRGEVESLAGNTKQVLNTAKQAVEDATGQLLEAAGTKIVGPAQEGYLQALQKAETSFKAMTTFAEKGDLVAARSQMNAYTSAIDKLGKTVGIETNVRKPLLEYIQTHTLARELAGFPKSVDGLASLTPAKAERIAAALDTAAKTKFAGAQAIQDAVNNLGKTLGLGQDSISLRNIWKASKGVLRSEGKVPKALLPDRPVKTPVPPRPRVQEPLTEYDHHPSVARRAMGYALGAKAGLVARGAGMGSVGGYAAYKATRDFVTYGGMNLIKMRAGVLGEIREAAAKYLPSVTKATSPLSRVEPLSRTLFGEDDKTTTDRRALAAARAAEFARMAPTAKDTLFRALEPLGVTQPALAPAIHTAAMIAFEYMQQNTPKDPGVVSRLKSVWKPSDIESVLFSKRYAVFQNPTGEAKSMLVSGQFDPIKIEALQAIAPNTWQDLRMALLQRITMPEVNAKLTYQDQIGLSAMLGVDLHTSMQPSYIAASQDLFVKRNQISPSLPNTPSVPTAGGTPSNNPNSTAAQRSTER